jgi:hypothetical protein
VSDGQAFVDALKKEMDVLWDVVVEHEAKFCAMHKHGVWCPTDEQIKEQKPRALAYLRRLMRFK